MRVFVRNITHYQKRSEKYDSPAVESTVGESGQKTLQSEKRLEYGNVVIAK